MYPKYCIVLLQKKKQITKKKRVPGWEGSKSESSPFKDADGLLEALEVRIPPRVAKPVWTQV